jgi:hypothetical protein
VQVVLPVVASTSTVRLLLDGSILVEGMGLDKAETEDAHATADVLRRLGTMEHSGGESTTVRIDAVGLPGQAGSRVQVKHRVVSFDPPTVSLRDLEPEELDGDVLPDGDARPSARPDSDED